MQFTYTSSDLGDLPGKLIILEGPDGSGKTTQGKRLKKALQKLGHQVIISSWRDGRTFRDFFNEQATIKKKKIIHPAANLILQAGDMMYRIEKRVIPKLQKGHIVIMDRGLETIYARGYTIGLTHEHIHDGILWPVKHIYQPLFDTAMVVYFDASLPVTIQRMQGRLESSHGQIARGTIMDLHMLTNMRYCDDGSKMTLAKKRALARKIQHDTIKQYAKMSVENTHGIQINANLSREEVLDTIMEHLQPALSSRWAVSENRQKKKLLRQSIDR